MGKKLFKGYIKKVDSYSIRCCQFNSNEFDNYDNYEHNYEIKTYEYVAHINVSIAYIDDTGIENCIKVPVLNYYRSLNENEIIKIKICKHTQYLIVDKEQIKIY